LIDCSINFHQPTYITTENNGSVQVELVLSNPVSFDFTMKIDHYDRSTIGMYPPSKMLILFSLI